MFDKITKAYARHNTGGLFHFYFFLVWILSSATKNEKNEIRENAIKKKCTHKTEYNTKENRLKFSLF